MEWLQNRIDSLTRLSLSASWPAGNLKVICVNPFEFNRYVDDFLLDEIRHMVYKNGNQLGECSHYVNYFVYKIKNADFFSPQFLSAKLQACMPLTNMEKEKSIIVYKGQW